MLESFFIFGNLPANAEKGVYHVPLIVLSYIIASFASYTALALVQQLIRAKNSRERFLLHWGGAFAMGAGIWSMHFVGMLSYQMRMAVEYDPFLTLLSMLIAIAVAYGALGIVARERLSLSQILIGAIVLGFGISGMHYTGMAAMKMDGDLRYMPGIFLLSVAIAIAASAIALWAGLTLVHHGNRYRYLFQTGAALVLGAAICGMHYTGMAASVFIPYANCRYNPNQSFDLLAVAIAAITSMILGVALAVGFHKRQQTEAQLQETTALLAAIVGSSDDAIISKTLGGIITSWNASAERLYGYSATEAIGQPVTLILPPDRHVEEEEIMSRLRRGEATRHFETVRVSKGGNLIDISLTVSPIRDIYGTIIGASKVARDITERKQAQEALNKTEKKLQQSQKMEAIGSLTGGMAHDFNNLLSIIIGNLDILLGRLKDNDEAKQLTQAALEAALRGGDLTRRLLAFARQQPLQPIRLNINILVEGIIRLLSRTLGENIKISLNLADDIWPVTVDPAQLESTLTNLGTNARDAMPRGGQLIISTCNRRLDADYAARHSEVTPGDYAVIEVSDTGAGMPSEIASRIFEPFFTTKERGKGTGLGLAMVFGFIKQSKGHVSVYSEVGKGTTFRLYFPRAPGDAPAEVQNHSQKIPVIGGHETILVVEDNEEVRRVVVRQLQELGYHVLQAGNATDAFEILTGGERVDLLFTDIVMPGKMNGLELARLAIQRWPLLKAVLTSGFPETKLNGHGESTTGLRLLSKPYRKDELASVLREVLSGTSHKVI
jgi:PAS domain S-box-containing protein